MNVLKAITAILLGITAFISFNLGMDWINFGYGLHPAIAFTAVPVLCAIALYVHCIPVAEYEEETILTDKDRAAREQQLQQLFAQARSAAAN